MLKAAPHPPSITLLQWDLEPLTLSGPGGGRILHLFMKMQITQEPLHRETWDYPLFLSLGLVKNYQIMTHPWILAPTAAGNNFLLAAVKFL